MFLNDIVEGLCRLLTHNDVDIRNGASLLDRLVKDIAAESHPDLDIQSFLPLLQRVIGRMNVVHFALTFLIVYCQEEALYSTVNDDLD